MRLENVLREAAARIDPVPPSLVQFATEVFTVGNLEQELTELIEDSWMDAGALTRGDGETRMLTFTSVGGTGSLIEVAVTRTGTGFEVTGQISPPARGEARVIYRGGVTPCQVDDLGRFDAEIPVAGSIRLWFLSGAAAAEVPIVTQWVAIG